MIRVIALAALVLATLGGLTAAAAAPLGATVDQQKTVGAYRLTLQIGPAEVMSMHPKGNTGEVMLGGRMAACHMAGHSMGNMSMAAGTCNRHFEIHVANRRTGKIVTGASVTIRLTNVRTHRSIGVPTMTMQGAGKSRADLHYGNNIYAARGLYSVAVLVNGTTALFNVRLN